MEVVEVRVLGTVALDVVRGVSCALQRGARVLVCAGTVRELDGAGEAGFGELVKGIDAEGAEEAVRDSDMDRLEELFADKTACRCL